jgi:sterol desaturase/sphingolipid hydroxylase (fatty acid hydroxylase superfamily)
MQSTDKPDLTKVLESAALPVKAAGRSMKATAELLQDSGELPVGKGMITGAIAFTLAFLCLLGVLAFHFPEYLTTPELRHKYSVDALRILMAVSLVVAGALALANLIFRRSRSLNFVALAQVLLAVSLGGANVPVGDFPDNTPYIGLDWFILDLLGSTMIFVLIEKLFPLYKGQQLFRKEWQTDLVHFMVNHFAVGLVLLVVNLMVQRIFGWLVRNDFQAFIQAIHVVPQLLLCILLADLMQYWTHRAYHEVPSLWKFHAVHHSAKTMDWLAGSRMHILELFVTRIAVLGPLFVFGFSKQVMDLYIIIVGFQAVFNHANVHLPWGLLRHILVTPDFHHWHHASDKEAIDKNYAAHYAFLDRIFGTDIKNPSRQFPAKYGVVGTHMPDGFVNQQLAPFKQLWKKAKQKTQES